MTRLLIADDNAAIREILTIAANAAGFDTVLAIDGADAWQKFSSENIDRTQKYFSDQTRPKA